MGCADNDNDGDVAVRGWLCGVQVQLRNVGLLPASNLKVAVSSPGVALAAAAAAKQQDAATAAAGSTDSWQELLGEAATWASNGTADEASLLWKLYWT
jgi:hypothetical protein